MTKTPIIAGALAAMTLFAPMAQATSVWPLQESAYVHALDWHQFEMTFYGNSSAYVEVIPQGGPVQVHIYDENFNWIESSPVSSSFASVNWNPIWTGTFYVEIENLSGYGQTYQIYSN